MADSGSKGNDPGNSQKGGKRRTIIVWKKCCFCGIRKKEEDTIFQMCVDCYKKAGTNMNAPNTRNYGSRRKGAAK